MIKAPHYVHAIKPYIPGKPIEELVREIGIENPVKLASNENPLGPSPMALKAIEGHKGTIGRYPDGGGYYLKSELAARYSVSMEEIILGNGSNELLDIVVRTFMSPSNDAVMAWPSFIVYPMAVESIGAKAIKVPLKEERHDLETMAEAITSQTRIVFIANPNNPTGTMVNVQEFDRFMKKIPAGTLVIVDEAYYEYVLDKSYPDTLKYHKDGADILILRTFSKAYGLAGLRIGYGIAGRDVITEMNKIREPFNTSSLSQAAASAALSDREHIRRSIEINEDGKAYLYKELSRLDIEYVRTYANFIYIDLKRAAAGIYERLLSLGVIIRPMGATHIRVTIGLQRENEKFIAGLKEVL